MPLELGARLGPYEVISLAGAGGMGEVYRARDTRLDRDVALKLVLDSFVADRERTLRFEREAKTLAALNHPNIATLHGIEQAGDRHFLVMELVEGETLAERIVRHPSGIAIEEALPLARQVAEALEAAHEKGIVHRDLKPANIKVTPDDKVKVLDFGLARITEPDGGSSMKVAQSPTMSAIATQAGVILGTASYMSPEQARGLAADHRSDVFSFGIVLYEMLCGRQPFPGETISDVLASVLAREADLTALPPALAPRLIDLIKRCLEKNPKRRWQAIGDVRYEIDSLLTSPRAVEPVAVPAAAPPPRAWWRRALPFAATALIAAAGTGAVMWLARPSQSDPAQVTRFTIAVPPDMKLPADHRGDGGSVTRRSSAGLRRGPPDRDTAAGESRAEANLCERNARGGQQPGVLARRACNRLLPWRSCRDHQADLDGRRVRCYGRHNRRGATRDDVGRRLAALERRHHHPATPGILRRGP